MIIQRGGGSHEHLVGKRYSKTKQLTTNKKHKNGQKLVGICPAQPSKVDPSALFF